MVLVITAPSGSGKTTIYKKLLNRRSDLRFCVSHTSRPPRGDEKEGVDYHFISTEEFQRKIESRDFVEWARVHGELYGTDRQSLKACRQAGRVCILDVDVQGAGAIRSAVPDAVAVFIRPPSLEELRRRLLSRGTETEESVRLRLENANKELEMGKAFDYIVVNDEVERAASEIETIVDRELDRRSV
jgi:guanylate kinase